MAEKREPTSIGRREFIAGAGAVVIAGAAAALAACAPSVKKGEEVAKAGLIVHNAQACVGCGVCGLMCSLYHDGEQGPSLSRSDVIRAPFTYDHTFYVCQQCDSPSCYYACPLKDEARKIDVATGARYVNAEECIGCGKCIKACPFDPVRVKMHPERNVAFNCDLCRGRSDGPICVQYCTMNALAYVRADKRGQEDA